MSAPQTLQATGFTTRDLCFSVEARPLLSGISIDFPQGVVSALVGHNGSGKSTLLKLLARQQQPSGGSIVFDGEPLQAIGARDFARRVAYLAQDTSSATGMSVRELVACGRYPWHGAVGRFSDNDREKVETALAMAGLEAMAERMVDTLSGGERQRAWIAMLIAQDSRCLLLDEPTSALDIAHQIEVLSLIRRLSHDNGLSVIVVLHDINMAARFCDHIYALKGGKLVADGRPDTFLNAETLRAIYGVEMGVIPHPDSAMPLAYVR
ncbi:iron-hydroxamate transporter ATP-binding subunit [Martelella endophytica]|uniref:Iron-hydroxamate transporter ATP-binding subunit n=1 Tax=Martelella endophytica TaxID=1486262 RepID=A0A0D5LVM2_MAREN|nr:iron-hydroxamate transporter ATP-binding subunit [Martelella endophytica]